LPNHFLRRFFMQGRYRGRAVHLHLGSGTKYLVGFINIDANPFAQIDAWLDARNGLPFPANSADSVYSTHMFEHFYDDELRNLLRECLRILKPGAGIRLIVPSLSSAISAYQEKRLKWFYEDFPHRFDSLGGRFSNFIFCDGQHRTAFDFSYLEEELRKGGFGESESRAEAVGGLMGGKGHPLKPGVPADFETWLM